MVDGIVARGEKSIVRWFQRTDAERRQRWPKHTDPLYSHNDPRPMSPRDRDLWYLERTTGSGYRMFAVDNLDGDLVGWITLRNVNRQAGKSVLGIALDPTRMNQGYGTDALMAFLDYYFESMKFREMWLDVAGFNTRGKRCYEKCGFRYVGQHWTEHPVSLFPPVFTDPLYKEVLHYFRRSTLGIEVLYYDMVVDYASFVRRKLATRENGSSFSPPRRVPARRAVGR